MQANGTHAFDSVIHVADTGAAYPLRCRWIEAEPGSAAVKRPKLTQVAESRKARMGNPVQRSMCKESQGAEILEGMEFTNRKIKIGSLELGGSREGRWGYPVDKSMCNELEGLRIRG
jgi:hypothetical protein